MDTILVRYSEIGLKGKNRYVFEKRLIHNIKDCLNKNKCDYNSIRLVRGRIIIESKQKCDELKNVFGIFSFGNAVSVKPDMENMRKNILEKIEDMMFDSFRISVQRLNKNFPKNSMEIEAELGADVVKKYGKDVDLENPELNIQIEINDKAYVFFARHDAYGGLPVGTQSPFMCKIKEKKDLLACVLIMRRGSRPIVAGDPQSLKEFEYGFKIGKDTENAKSIVVGQTLEEYKPADSELPVLRPLIGFSRKEIDALYKFYFK